MLIDLRTKFPDLTGKVAEKALVAADITVNKNMVPFDSRSAFQPPVSVWVRPLSRPVALKSRLWARSWN